MSMIQAMREFDALPKVQQKAAITAAKAPPTKVGKEEPVYGLQNINELVNRFSPKR